MRPHGDIDFHAWSHVIAEQFLHPADRLTPAARLLDQLHRHNLTVTCSRQIVRADQDVLGDAAVIGHDETHAPLDHQTADDGLVATLQHVDHRTFLAATSILTGNAHQRAITVQ